MRIRESGLKTVYEIELLFPMRMLEKDFREIGKYNGQPRIVHRELWMTVLDR